MPPQLPGLDKARGQAPPDEEPIPVLEDLMKAVEVLKGQVADANRRANVASAKFTQQEQEIARYQTAVAALVAEDDPKKRQAIRDGLQG